VCGKSRSATEQEARDKLVELQSRGHRGKRPQRVYRCPKCGYWLLTSMGAKAYEEKRGGKGKR
jgi:rubrerythrin